MGYGFRWIWIDVLHIRILYDVLLCKTGSDQFVHGSDLHWSDGFDDGSDADHLENFQDRTESADRVSGSVLCMLCPAVLHG